MAGGYDKWRGYCASRPCRAQLKVGVMQERRLQLQLRVSWAPLHVGLVEKSLIAAIIFAVVHLEAKHTLSSPPPTEKEKKLSISNCITKNACLTLKSLSSLIPVVDFRRGYNCTISI